jgi:ornithine decarboxylase
MSKILSFYGNRRIRSKPIGQYAYGVPSLETFASTDEMIAARKPALPVYTLSPKKLQDAAAHFVASFPGKTLFAVKTNPQAHVIKNLAKGGVQAFDVASAEEMRLVKSVAPFAELYFMHPVKAPEAIREAYFVHGVRHFVLDHEDELYKIMRETELATDLKLYVRVTLPKNANAHIDLSEKFGATPDEAVELLRQCRNVCDKLGVAFHVGTQITDSSAFANAVSLVKSVITRSGVKVDVLDVGGGFPVPYVGEDVPSIVNCIDVIKTAITCAGLEDMELIAEPGRVLVAQSGSLVVRVELRKGNRLYLNDGTYGGLFDAGPLLGTRYPVRALRLSGEMSEQTEDFTFAGPTCDSLDMMNGPFTLPADIDMGDWIEIGNLGAYSHSMRTNFNGFGASESVLIAPES